MGCLWAVFISTLCACALAKRNPIDLGRVRVHSRSGSMADTYPPHDEDNEATINMRMALEKLRPYFPTGLGHIPRLDPYRRLAPIVFNVKRSDFDCEITITNVNVYGAKRFVLNAPQIYLATNRVDFKLEFPELDVSLNYHVRLHYDEAMTDFDTHANIMLKQVAASVAMSVDRVIHYPVGEVFNVIGMNVNTTIDDVQYNLLNLLRSRRSVPASKLTHNIVKDVEDDVALAVVKAMMEDLTQILFKFTADQIMHLLLPPQ